jgi:hypothetical protein
MMKESICRDAISLASASLKNFGSKSRIAMSAYFHLPSGCVY